MKETEAQRLRRLDAEACRRGMPSHRQQSRSQNLRKYQQELAEEELPTAPHDATIPPSST